MPAKPATKSAGRSAKDAFVIPKLDDEEDINRLPDSSSGSEDERGNIDITPTAFGAASSKGKTGISDLARRQAQFTSSKSLRDEKGAYRGTARPSPRVSRAASPSSSASTAGSTKRKSPAKHNEEIPDEIFKKNPRSKKAKFKYGSSQPRPSQNKPSSQKSNPKDSPDAPPSSFVNFALDDEDLMSTPAKKMDFRRPSMSPEQSEEQSKAEFKRYGLDEAHGSFTLSSHSQDPDPPLPPQPGPPGDLVPDSPAPTPKQLFQKFDLDLDDDVIAKATALLGNSKDKPARFDLDDEQFLSMTQRGRCPMCNAPVDAADLREFGKNMNVRMQERFCRAHKMKTARANWEDRNYPTIKWEKLDRRISKHHSMIKKMINGETSYYREQMEEVIKAGKDRSLMKMTTNLTPGYYGARGLRAISENIMHKFTVQLKKRAIEDELMSARGVTPYVQSVLVPEIASRLIMEDMKVSLEKAREILGESTEIGELLNEELRDVVKKTVSDSEDVDEDED